MQAIYGPVRLAALHSRNSCSAKCQQPPKTKSAEHRAKAAKYNPTHISHANTITKHFGLIRSVSTNSSPKYSVREFTALAVTTFTRFQSSSVHLCHRPYTTALSPNQFEAPAPNTQTIKAYRQHVEIRVPRGVRRWVRVEEAVAQGPGFAVYDFRWVYCCCTQITPLRDIASSS